MIIHEQIKHADISTYVAENKLSQLLLFERACGKGSRRRRRRRRGRETNTKAEQRNEKMDENRGERERGVDQQEMKDPAENADRVATSPHHRVSFPQGGVGNEAYRHHNRRLSRSGSRR